MTGPTATFVGDHLTRNGGQHMQEDEPSPVLASLGIDPATLAADLPPGVWDNALQAAFDPDAVADPDTVPDMDDTPPADLDEDIDLGDDNPDSPPSEAPADPPIAHVAQDAAEEGQLPPAEEGTASVDLADAGVEDPHPGAHDTHDDI
ncbi:hypothetical protein [Gordonia sp. SMJS1]|uniref:hypothetical protein n=1 Tax=Gordonia sp. SMJS1 TaxID=3039400 RepID=UPI0024537A65|nr:hypothetical protein [Gordonia sp. SMJS1]WGJ88148.1 hypothetical protein QAD21_24015 [Gordonia sp. SMJS1]